MQIEFKTRLPEWTWIESAKSKGNAIEIEPEPDPYLEISDGESEKSVELQNAPPGNSRFVLIENEKLGQGEMVEVDIEEKINYFRKEHRYKLDNPQKVILTYENYELRTIDMLRLAPDTFLNDSVVNFFMKLFGSFAFTKEARRDIHVFNTYFWKNLETSVKSIAQLVKSRAQAQTMMFEQYKSISKAHKAVDLFSKKHLLIPINRQGHWSVMLATNVTSLLHCAQKKVECSSLPASLRPNIYYLDPLWDSDTTLGGILRLYLEAALFHVLGPEYQGALSFRQPAEKYLVTEKSMPDHQAITPSQRNAFDCGLFVLEYVENFCADPQSFIEKMVAGRNNSRWFPHSMVGFKRVMLINVIMQRMNGMEYPEILLKYMESRQALRANTENDDAEFEDPASIVQNNKAFIEEIPPPF